jgi:hypothetical protein
MPLNNLLITKYQVDLINPSKKFSGGIKSVTITFKSIFGPKKRDKSFGFTIKKQQSIIQIRKLKNELRRIFN